MTSNPFVVPKKQDIFMLRDKERTQRKKVCNYIRTSKTDFNNPLLYYNNNDVLKFIFNSWLFQLNNFNTVVTFSK